MKINCDVLITGGIVKRLSAMFEEIASIYFLVTKSVDKTDRIQVHLLDVDMLLVHFRSSLAF